MSAEPSSSETPNSAETARPAEPPIEEFGLPDPGFRGYLDMLRLTRSRWELIAAAPATKAAAVVIGSWLVLAWGRFGFQGLEAPRAIVRFVLVGVYGWLGLAALSWLGLRLRSGLSQTVDRPGAAWPAIDPARLLQVTGLAHQPLLVLAIAIQIGQAIPIPFVLPTLTAIVFGLWLPGQLLAATASAAGGTIRRAAPMTAVAYLIWLATAGRHMYGQLGHLI